MPLTPGQISDRLPNGAQRQLAAKLSVSESYVSRVVQGTMQASGARGKKSLRRVQVAIARRIGMKVDEVFGSALTLSQRPEHAPHDGGDVLGRGESRARFDGGMAVGGMRRDRVASG